MLSPSLSTPTEGIWREVWRVRKDREHMISSTYLSFPSMRFLELEKESLGRERDG
jgi:hypothetical protein